MSGAAHAWPACNGNWVNVPAGTKATATSGYGAVVTENGTTYQCQQPTPNTPTTSTNTNTNTNTSASSSSSNSSASASAQGGNANQKQNQTQTLNNTNSNNASANGGNSTNQNTYNSEYHAAASSAIAEASPTAPCVVGFGFGGQALLGGASISGGKIDKVCQTLEVARSFANFGSDDAYCKMMLSLPQVQKAGVTYEGCMRTRTQPVPAPAVSVQNTPTPVAPPDVTIENIEPAPVVLAPLPNLNKESAPPTPKSNIRYEPFSYPYNGGIVFVEGPLSEVCGKVNELVSHGVPRENIRSKGSDQYHHVHVFYEITEQK